MAHFRIRYIMFYKSGHLILHRTSIVLCVCVCVCVCVEFVETLIAKLIHAFLLLSMKIKILQVRTVDLYVFGVCMYIRIRT